MKKDWWIFKRKEKEWKKKEKKEGWREECRYESEIYRMCDGFKGEEEYWDEKNEEKMNRRR